jgi:hypothetical protein
MDLYKQTGSKFFTADFTIPGGRRIRKSTKQTTKAKAFEVAVSIRQADLKV